MTTLPLYRKGKGKAVEEPETNDASAAYDLVGSDYDEEEDGDYEVDLEAESDDESDGTKG